MALGRSHHRNIFEAIMANHLHPTETAKAPDWISRRAAANFLNLADIADGENIVLGAVTYTFVTALGSPAANNVQILIQPTLRATVQRMAAAMRGETDAANIAYGTSTNPHPTIVGYWTSMRFAILTTQVAAGENLFLLEKQEDINTAAPTFTSTTAGTLVQFVRDIKSQYVFTGNHASDLNLSISGPYQCILPIGSVRLGGQSSPGALVAYDPHVVTMTGQSTASEKEVDVYYSFDEVTFTRTSRSIPFSSGTIGAGAVHVQSMVKGRRIPAGAGLYIKCRMAGTGATATGDFTVSYHLYPESLS